MLAVLLLLVFVVPIFGAFAWAWIKDGEDYDRAHGRDPADWPHWKDHP